MSFNLSLLEPPDSEFFDGDAGSSLEEISTLESTIDSWTFSTTRGDDLATPLVDDEGRPSGEETTTTTSTTDPNDKEKDCVFLVPRPNPSPLLRPSFSPSRLGESLSWLNFSSEDVDGEAKASLDWLLDSRRTGDVASTPIQCPGKAVVGRDKVTMPVTFHTPVMPTTGTMPSSATMPAIPAMPASPISIVDQFQAVDDLQSTESDSAPKSTSPTKDFVSRSDLLHPGLEMQNLIRCRLQNFFHSALGEVGAESGGALETAMPNLTGLAIANSLATPMPNSSAPSASEGVVVSTQTSFLYEAAAPIETPPSATDSSEDPTALSHATEKIDLAIERESRNEVSSLLEFLVKEASRLAEEKPPLPRPPPPPPPPPLPPLPANAAKSSKDRKPHFLCPTVASIGKAKFKNDANVKLVQNAGQMPSGGSFVKDVVKLSATGTASSAPAEAALATATSSSSSSSSSLKSKSEVSRIPVLTKSSRRLTKSATSEPSLSAASRRGSKNGTSTLVPLQVVEQNKQNDRRTNPKKAERRTAKPLVVGARPLSAKSAVKTQKENRRPATERKATRTENEAVLTKLVSRSLFHDSSEGTREKMMEMENRRKDEEIDELKRRLRLSGDELCEENVFLQDENKIMEETLMDSQKRLAEGVEEQRRLMQEILALKEERKALLEERCKGERTIGDLKLQLELVAREMEKLKPSNRRLENENESLLEMMRESEAQLQNLRQELDNLKRIHQEQEMAMVEKQQKMTIDFEEKLEKEKEISRSEMKRRLESQEANLHEQITTIEKELVKLRDQLGSRQQEIRDVNDENLKLKEKRAETEAALRQAEEEKKFLETERSITKEAASESEAEAASLRRETAELRRRLRDLESQVENQKKEARIVNVVRQQKDASLLSLLHSLCGDIGEQIETLARDLDSSPGADFSTTPPDESTHAQLIQLVRERMILLRRFSDSYSRQAKETIASLLDSSERLSREMESRRKKTELAEGERELETAQQRRREKNLTRELERKKEELMKTRGDLKEAHGRLIELGDELEKHVDQSRDLQRTMASLAKAERRVAALERAVVSAKVDADLERRRDMICGGGIKSAKSEGDIRIP